jgi:hypothetical protein
MFLLWFVWFWPLLVRLPKAPTPDHQILMVFDGFGGFGLCFCGFGGFGRC